MKQNSSAGLSRKAWSKEEIEDSVKTRVKHEELLELSLAILDGNDESAADLEISRGGRFFGKSIIESLL